MSFFNPKLDVLDVKLTTHGIQQFANGEFNPVYFVPKDDGVVYDDTYDTDEEEREYLRETLAFLRPQRENFGIDTNLSNQEFFTSDISLCAIGTAREQFVNNDAYLSIPNNSFAFASGKVTLAEKTDSGVIEVTLADLDTKVRLVTNPANESIQQHNLFEKNGLIYSFDEKYLFLTCNEDGTEFLKDNYMMFLYEDVGNDVYRPVILEYEYLNEFGLQESKQSALQEIDLLMDHEIPMDYLCLHAPKMNTAGHLTFSNGGTVNVELTGRVCSNVNKKFPKVYINRKEKNLGDEC
jgi:hypothetical protein